MLYKFTPKASYSKGDKIVLPRFVDAENEIDDPETIAEVLEANGEMYTVSCETLSDDPMDDGIREVHVTDIAGLYTP